MNARLPIAAAAPSPVKQILKQLVGIALAALFLWLAFRTTNFKELWQHMQNINMAWIAVVAALAVVSHLVRAWRWTIMLRPLAQKPIGLWNAFCAVVIGYAVNIAVPRGGEVARVVSICKTESLPWVGVLPTMLIDRLLDVAMLAFLLGTTLVMLPVDIRDSMKWLVPTGAALCVATVVGLLVLPMTGKIMKWLLAVPAIRSRMPDKVFQKVSELSEQFDLGTGSLRNPAGLSLIAFLSVAVWGLYFLTFYAALAAFDLQSQLDLSRVLIVFTIGSVSMLIPTPGGFGSYHYAVSESLQKIGHINAAQATAFATVIHAVTFVLVVCVVAAVCFLVQQGANRSNAPKVD